MQGSSFRPSDSPREIMDSEQLRICYEGVVKHDPQDISAVQFLAMWHLERQSYQQARKYFGHLATLKPQDLDVWISLSICCAMAEEFQECATALKFASNIEDSQSNDVRIWFCRALLLEKKREFNLAMEGYVKCLQLCATQAINSCISDESSHINTPPSYGTAITTAATTTADPSISTAIPLTTEQENEQSIESLNVSTRGLKGHLLEIKGEIMLRMAMMRKESGGRDQALFICDSIIEDSYSEALRANAICLKGIMYDTAADYPSAESIYRAALLLIPNHNLALERLGRVYLRFRETIPAAVQCFFKVVESNPSNHMGWYLLGRCYMATAQYSDAFEAYNRAINLNPNDAQIWCSLGVLYYAFGQYKEALGMLGRALKLDHTMADAWYNVGALYDMVDQPEDAQQAYEKARYYGIATTLDQAGVSANPISSSFSSSSSFNYVSATGLSMPMVRHNDTPVLRSSLDRPNIHSMNRVPSNTPIHQSYIPMPTNSSLNYGSNQVSSDFNMNYQNLPYNHQSYSYSPHNTNINTNINTNSTNNSNNNSNSNNNPPDSSSYMRYSPHMNSNHNNSISSQPYHPVSSQAGYDNHSIISGSSSSTGSNYNYSISNSHINVPNYRQNLSSNTSTTNQSMGMYSYNLPFQTNNNPDLQIASGVSGLMSISPGMQSYGYNTISSSNSSNSGTSMINSNIDQDMGLESSQMSKRQNVLSADRPMNNQGYHLNSSYIPDHLSSESISNYTTSHPMIGIHENSTHTSH